MGSGVQARRVLEKIRGTKDVDEEYQDILEKAELAAMVKNPWTLLLFRKKYRCGRDIVLRPAIMRRCGSLRVSRWACRLTHSDNAHASQALKESFMMQAAVGVRSMQHPLPAVDW